MQRGLSVFKDLVIGDRVFQIPLYQRNYSWEPKQWDDLWNDLFYIRPDKKHYFGTILLKTTGEHKTSGLKSFAVYDIIDGQQRIATVLILLREMMQQLEKVGGDDIREQLNRLREDYLIYREVHKLELQGDDKEFFSTYIIKGAEYPRDILTPSQRKLREAKQFFRGKLEDLEKTKATDSFKTHLLELKQRIDNMGIIRYDVETDADAVLIFETVNDRGKVLSNLEKTKSFIMHIIYLSAPGDPTDYLNQVNRRFSEIFRWYEIITNSERGNTLTEDDIQKYHFIDYEPDARLNRKAQSYQCMDFLWRKIRRLYRSDKEKCLNYALEYTKDLEKSFKFMASHHI